MVTGAQWGNAKQRQWAQPETQEGPSDNQRTHFHCEGNRALEQAAQGHCGVSVPGDTQKSSGQLTVTLLEPGVGPHG